MVMPKDHIHISINHRTIISKCGNGKIPIEREIFDALLVSGFDRLVALEEPAAAAGVTERMLLTGLRFVNLELSTEPCLERDRWNPWGRVGDSGLS